MNAGENWCRMKPKLCVLYEKKVNYCNTILLFQICPFRRFYSIDDCFINSLFYYNFKNMCDWLQPSAHIWISWKKHLNFWKRVSHWSAPVVDAHLAAASSTLCFMSSGICCSIFDGIKFKLASHAPAFVQKHFGKHCLEISIKYH